MFDFFRRRTAKEFLSEAREAYNTIPEVETVKPPKDSLVYKVGKTTDGNITLSLGDYNSIYVTMNNDGVDQLIRMLEAAKDVRVDATGEAE
jgi:hypothetical protein